MFDFKNTKVPGLVVIDVKVFRDNRGGFVKTFHRDQFAANGLDFVPSEEFYSSSALGVLRGMHFQMPPMAHSKLVYCVKGSVLDVVVDLRKGENFGVYHSEILAEDNNRMLFIPCGCAHGFLATSNDATLIYKTDTVYSPECDAGILWDSFGFRWPESKPVLSARDGGHPPLSDFKSPF